MDDKRFDKEKIEAKLNKDEKFRARFLKSPADVLRAEGLNLSEESEAKLKQQLGGLRKKSMPSGASVAANGVMISISKIF